MRTLILLALVGINSFFINSGAHGLKVGLVLPLTGPTADYGIAISNAIRLAISDHNSLFTEIKFVTEDAQYNPALAVSAFKKLVDVDKVDLVYTWGVSFCKALAPLAESSQIPLIGQCIDQESSRGRQYVLRFMNHTDEYTVLLSSYLRSKDVTRIHVVLAENAYLEEYLESLRRQAQGISISLVERVPTSEMNFRPIISKLRRDHPQAIGVFLASGQISQFAKQAREQQFSVPIVGTNFFESLSEVLDARGALDGSVFANNDITQEFKQRYEQRYGMLSQMGFAAPAYEWARLLGVLFGRTKTQISAKQILSAFENVKSVSESVAGPYHFQNSEFAGKYFAFPVTIKSIRGSRFETIFSEQQQ